MHTSYTFSLTSILTCIMIVEVFVQVLTQFFFEIINSIIHRVHTLLTYHLITKNTYFLILFYIYLTGIDNFVIEIKHDFHVL